VSISSFLSIVKENEYLVQCIGYEDGYIMPSALGYMLGDEYTTRVADISKVSNKVVSCWVFDDSKVILLSLFRSSIG